MASIDRPGALDKYKIRAGGWYLQSLREMLTVDFGIHVWVELTIGYSYWGYNTLDLYVRCMNDRTEMLPEEAWYVLNGSRPPQYRRPVPPEGWYLCKDWYANGQKWRVDEAVYEALGVRAPAVVPRSMPSIRDGMTVRMVAAERERIQRMVEDMDLTHHRGHAKL